MTNMIVLFLPLLTLVAAHAVKERRVQQRYGRTERTHALEPHRVHQHPSDERNHEAAFLEHDAEQRRAHVANLHLLLRTRALLAVYLVDHRRHHNDEPEYHSEPNEC